MSENEILQKRMNYPQRFFVKNAFDMGRGLRKVAGNSVIIGDTSRPKREKNP